MAVLPTASKNAALDAIGALFDNASLHTGYPGAAGTANEVTGGSPAYARQAITWSAAASGNLDSSNQPLFDIPASTTVRWVGFWDTSGPTFEGAAPITGGGTYKAFTATASDDTLVSPAHGFSEDDEVTVIEVAGNSLPAGLTVGDKLFVILTDTDSFKVEATLGGGAVNITGDGVGLVVAMVPEVFASQGEYRLDDADIGL